MQFLDPNWLSKKTVGTASIVCYSQLPYISFILHTFFTWSSWILVRWKSSSFPSIFLHGRWRLATGIPISASLYHLFRGIKNAQNQPCVCVLQIRCSSKCCKIYRKTRVPVSIFNKLKPLTLLKEDFGTLVFLWIFRNY